MVAPGALGSEHSVILVVDDEPVLRNVVRSALTKAGFFVLAAENGPQALSVAREFRGRIDLLLTDINMPAMNGFELASLLLAERPGTRVLFMTGNEWAAELTAPGPWKVLNKPFTPSALVEEVREATKT